ncbi:disulfide bond formation protein DsbB [Bowmanella pacifica]|nr:disulfide bond formation protein DsbB [Bowmanella pacifica]
MSALGRLAIWSQRRQGWWLLFSASVGLLLVALYFQYAMGLAPCVMCIYQRTAVIGVMLASLVGLINPQFGGLRWAGMSIWGLSSVWGLLKAIEHVDIQTASNLLFQSCAIEPEFPAWMPLHHWLPSIFAATGDCGNIDWQWLSFSMPQWMIVILSLFSLVWLVVLLANTYQLITQKTA